MGHNIPLLVLTVINPIVYAVATIFNALSGDVGVKLGIFKNSTGTISDKYQVNITPAGWMFSIWGVIYVWEAVWIVYTIVNLFRKTSSGPCTVTHPPSLDILRLFHGQHVPESVLDPPL